MSLDIAQFLGPSTTAASAADQRLKVDVSSAHKKKSLKKTILKTKIKEVIRKQK